MKNMTTSSGVRTIQRNRRGPISRQRRSSTNRRSSYNRKPYSSGYSTCSTHSDADDREIMIESVLIHRNNGLYQRRKDYAPLQGDDLINDEFHQKSDLPSPHSIFEVPTAVSGKNEWILRFICVLLGATLYLSCTKLIELSPTNAVVSGEDDDVQNMINKLRRIPDHRNSKVRRKINKFAHTKPSDFLRGSKDNPVHVNIHNNDDMVYTENGHLREEPVLWGSTAADDYVDPYATKKRPKSKGSYMIRADNSKKLKDDPNESPAHKIDKPTPGDPANVRLSQSISQTDLTDAPNESSGSYYGEETQSPNSLETVIVDQDTAKAKILSSVNEKINSSQNLAILNSNVPEVDYIALKGEMHSPTREPVKLTTSVGKQAVVATTAIQNIPNQKTTNKGDDTARDSTYSTFQDGTKDRDTSTTLVGIEKPQPSNEKASEVDDSDTSTLEFIPQTESPKATDLSESRSSLPQLDGQESKVEKIDANDVQSSESESWKLSQNDPLHSVLSKSNDPTSATNVLDISNVSSAKTVVIDQNTTRPKAEIESTTQKPPRSNSTDVKAKDPTTSVRVQSTKQSNQTATTDSVTSSEKKSQTTLPPLVMQNTTKFDSSKAMMQIEIENVTQSDPVITTATGSISITSTSASTDDKVIGTKLTQSNSANAQQEKE